MTTVAISPASESPSIRTSSALHLYHHGDEVPVLATIAPPLPVSGSAPSPYDLSADPVLGVPLFDHLGILHHRQHRILWRKRVIGIQGRFLFYFDHGGENVALENTGPPKFVADLGQSDVTLHVDQQGTLVKEGGVNEWRNLATTFTISGESLPEGSMHFQASDPTECTRWCQLIQMAMHGRCQRCTVQPARSARHKYCHECTKLRKKEKEEERTQRAVLRLRSLLTLREDEDRRRQRRLSSDGEEIDPVSFDQRSPTMRSNRPESVGASSACTTPSASASSRPMTRHGLLDPIPSSQRSPMASPTFRQSQSTTSMISDDGENGSCSSSSRPSTTASSSRAPSLGNDSFSSTPSFRRGASLRNRRAGAVPGLLPKVIERLPQTLWEEEDGEPQSARNENREDADGCCSCCHEPFQNGCVVTTLPACTHTFHFACLRDCLQSQALCPKCNTEVQVSLDN